ncbi:aminoacyl-histidine dipeptidase [Salinispira pacifica]|uniref:Cytosol non-specific dipeptidase n=1 Tax=Salinispira pacifica TaxID=1307761 RepID=V5WJ95_9SPIO|nr:aminoacyl-histidine dipeptidase [Salinispira pacifica]AHC15614.1 Aminoacyl-histidine dipeptidase (Peptidase D) [Salinispira pacifica]
MIDALKTREPAILWEEFSAISHIPRCSKCEADILEYIEAAARENEYEIRRDKVGNMVVVLPPTEGCEQLPGIVVQGHVDMVCEQNEGTGHNFDTDPIRLKVDGDWLTADGTTLGADNGIAVASMLALIKGDFPHGSLELLFTVDEETGLTGATDLDPSIIKHRILINLDSEEEGYFYIGCAGGKETFGTLPLEWEKAPANLAKGKISITGLNGGHSGAEIHRELGNSLVCATRILHELKDLPIKLYNMYGGDKHNAIPREAFIEFLIDDAAADRLNRIAARFQDIFRDEFGETEKHVQVKAELQSSTEENYPERVVSAESLEKLSSMLYTIPHGIQSMSRAIPGLVSTSTNFASLKIEDSSVKILTSQRSDIRSQVSDISNRVASSFLLAGGSAEFTREYPGWQPDPDSALLEHAVNAYSKKTGKKPIITSIHAGLECGVIGAKCGGMEMISLGPDIRGAHTPDERVHISSAERVFQFFLELLVSF